MLKRIYPLLKDLARLLRKSGEPSRPSPETQASSEAGDATTGPAKPEWALASASSIAFSLTFFAGGLAMLLGVVPGAIARVPPTVDLAVLVLMVPLCALTFMIIAEVFRAAISGVPRVQPPRPAAALSEWRPGRGEG